MSSCLAITSMSRDRPPSEAGGACCAVAGAAAHTVGEGNGKEGGHAPRSRANRVGHRVPLDIRNAQQGCCVGQSVEEDSGRWRGAGLEQDVGDGRGIDRRQPAPTERRMFRWVCHEEIDRYGTVVAEREADLAIVIGQRRHGRGGRSRDGRDSPSRAYMKRSWVIMPGEQNSLEQDRECADERASSAPPLPSATGPNPYGKAHPHLDPMSPAGIRLTRRSGRVRAMIYYNVGELRTPFLETRSGLILKEVWSYPKRTG